METSFCELKGKEVINIVDGKKLGRIIDIVFDTHCGRMLGIVVPSYNKSWNIFKASDDIFIPFNCICKFGDDAILVQIFIPNQKPNFSKKGRFVKTATQGEMPIYAQNITYENQIKTDDTMMASQNTNQTEIKNIGLSQPPNEA
ncbi:MAG TPA: hypothetical protein DCO89_00970 [Clostridiales bacterium]|nr:hypothetical protein [Clostridiales bacterium]